MVVGRKINLQPSLKNVSQLLMLLFVLHKIAFYFLYSNRFTDHDQVTVWMMAADYARGHLDHLFFYGQNYNVALDALLAVPLIILGIPPYFAVPFVCLFISTFSVFLFWKYLMKSAKYTSAIVTVLIFLTGPFTFLYQYSSGISLAVHLTILFWTFSLYKPTILRICISIFVCTIVGFGIKNALPLAAAMAVYFTFNTAPVLGKRLIFIAFSGTMGVVIYYLLFEQSLQYLQIIHSSQIQGWRVQQLIGSLIKLPQLFWGLGPFLDFAGLIYFIIPIAFIILFFKRNKIIVYTNIAFITLTLISFGVDKVSDGHLNAYFPYVRFFLGIIPLTLINLLYLPDKIGNPKFFLIAGIAGLVTFYTVLDSSVKNHKNRNLSTGITPVKDILKSAQNPALVKLWNNHALCISMDDPSTMYAAQALFKNANTLYLPYDRRTEKYRVHYFAEFNQVFIYNQRISLNDTMIENYHLQRIPSQAGYLYQVQGSGLTLGTFMQKAGWEYFLKLD